MIVCNHAAPWLTGTEDVVCCTAPALFPPAVGGYTPPVSPRHPAAGQQTENPSSPATTRGYEEGTQRRENVGGVQTPRASRAQRRAQDSGARLKGSERRSGKKRPARVKARHPLVLLQPQLEQKVAEVATKSSRRWRGRGQRPARLRVKKPRALPREFVLGGEFKMGRDHEQLPIVT
ncbi:unnamed protein product, partial [Ectocarpus sp. 4 AP-2014]